MGWKKEINRNFKFGKSTEKRGFYVLVSIKNWSLFLGNPHPSPQHLPTFLPSGAWKPGETKMALHNGALVQLKCKHGFCQNAAWSFSSLTSYFRDHLNVIKEGTYFEQEGSSLSGVSDKHWSCTHVHGEFDHSTGKIWRFKLTVQC